MNNDIENFKKKLIYRSQYRGTKEMDKLIGSFVNSIIQKLNDDQLEKLEKFLSTDDNKLYKFYNNEIIEENFNNNEIFSLFKKFKY
tara:strand:+ start:230 stop:487 length:258 start_codon:yes stop_codon:yes gene_type:complete